MPPKAADKKPASKAPATASKAPEKKDAGKKTAASGEKKKRTKARKETYSSYIYKGEFQFSTLFGTRFPPGWLDSDFCDIRECLNPTLELSQSPLPSGVQ